MDNHAEIRDFLASRRARITPDLAGLPAYGGNRRVKGLRREEVALLAGVSIDYYVRMERGNLAGVSDQVLESVANALQLDDAEQEHLRSLARVAGPTAARRRQAPVAVRPVIQQVLDAITDAPAWVRNARHDVIAMNPMANALYSPVLHSAAAGPTSRRPANTTRFLYLDPAAREFFIDFDRMAMDAAAMLRLEAGRHPYDNDLITLVGELSTQSRAFPSALGIAERQVPSQRPQTASTPAQSANSTSISKAWSSRRPGPAAQHLHGRPRHPYGGRSQDARHLGSHQLRRVGSHRGKRDRS